MAAAGAIASPPSEQGADEPTDQPTNDRRTDRAGRYGEKKGNHPPSSFPVTNPPIESRGGGGGGVEFPAVRG
jgi:hypothetical protein